MVQFTDRRRGNKKHVPPPGGVPLDQYFAPEMMYKEVKRGELYSILAIQAETIRQRKWRVRLWMILTGKKRWKDVFHEAWRVWRATRALRSRLRGETEEVVKPEPEREA